MDVLVVGAGAMGRWFGATLAAVDEATFDVAFTDLDAEAAATAADAIGGRDVPTDTEDRFDVVCLAVPMSIAEAAIDEYADRAIEALVDVTGAMAEPVAAMAAHAPNRERASLHPLFAPSNAPGNVAAVRASPGPTTDAVLDAIAAAGNDVFETTPAEHDEAMATVQASAHTAVLAYALAAESVPDRFQTPISEGLLDLVEQVTGNSPQVYAEIQSTFDGADAVAAAARRIAEADTDEAFVELYEEARSAVDESAGAGHGGDQ
ncbi:prephenate dehydrogenase [Natronoarchaeum philippinense]|uniref:Prephenate dehydrogenase n=1 Tax=Natronoarchaeum philippinense TaxID=558529 RepID=A0A285NUM6_NATPI|nr:prephenate dehydrogenase/arogenate dehydrogenase family protein [Natronoarchaeum philippinense]SNZ13192.1 prephenate dehydrogenase [Natronoarchaeum philippinense]